MGGKPSFFQRPSVDLYRNKKCQKSCKVLFFYVLVYLLIIFNIFAGLNLSTYINLNQSFMKKILFLFTLLLITSSLVMAQTVQITGTVAGSEDRLAMPG